MSGPKMDASLPPPPRPDLRALIPPRPDVPRGPTPRRNGRLVRGVAIAVGVALLLAGVGNLRPAPEQPGDRAAPTGAQGSAGRSFGFFERTVGGQPVRWNPCEPVAYQIDLGPMTPGAAEDVHEAFARMSSATGISFAFEGFVRVDVLQRFHDGDFVAPGPDGGLAWAPILVAWRPQRFLLGLGVDRDVIGLGLPIATRLDRGQYVSGVVVLNADAGLPGGFATGLGRGPLILHELGHVLGLGHVDDRSQLMFRRSVPWVTGFGQGDRAGLERLGVDSGCLVTPTAELDAALVPVGLGSRS